MKTVLLTGATGFLGSNLLRKLVETKEYNVIILKRSFSNVSRIVDLLESKKIVSYNCDEDDLEKAFKDNNVDVIIHCATEYGRTSNSSYKVLETNLMFPIKLLDLGVAYNVGTFINTDSYFNKENLSYSYLADYSMSKKSLLMWLQYYSKKIKVVNMRLEHIFGYDDNPDKFCKFIFEKLVNERVKELDLTYGDQKRDFIYIEDAVVAYLKVLEYIENHNFRMRNFDIGTGVAIPIKSFVEYVNAKVGNNTILNFGKLPYREDEIMYSVADIVELENIDFKAKYSYRQGIDFMFEQYYQRKGRNDN